jgi:hypothetical protein
VAMAKFGIAPDDADGLVQDVFATYFMPIVFLLMTHHPERERAQ